MYGPAAGGGVAERDPGYWAVSTSFKRHRSCKALRVMGGYHRRPARAWSMRTGSYAAGVHLLPRSLPPVVAGGARPRFRHLKSDHMLRARNHQGARTLKIAAKGLGPADSSTTAAIIVPVHVGNPVKCKMLSDRLLQDFGVYVCSHQLPPPCRAGPSV